MLSRFLSYLTHFFPRHLSVQLRELYLTIGIMNLAVAAVMIFEPIYLLQRGLSLKSVLLFYFVVYVLYLAIMPLGAKFALSFGFNRSIITSSFFLVAYYLTLLGLQHSPLFIVLAVPCFALQKTLYWPGFHAEFARYGDDHEEAREVSSREAIDVFTAVVGPFFGGLILFLSNFTTLFVVVCLLVLLSNLPLALTPEVFTPGHFSYRGAYRRLFEPEHRRLVVSTIGYGEEFIAVVLWPVFMYYVVQSFFELGSIVAGATLLTTAIVLYVGRLADHTNKRAVLRAGSLLYSLVWLARLFVAGVGGLFWADALSRLTKRILAVPQLALIYERARETHHIMRTTLLFEMSLVVGKITAIIAALLVISFIPEVAWPVTFILAAAFTLLYTLL